MNKKILPLLILLLTVMNIMTVIGTSIDSSSNSPSDDWWMLGHDTGYTRSTTANAPANISNTQVITFSTSADVDGSPIIVDDNLYIHPFNFNSAYLYKLNALNISQLLSNSTNTYSLDGRGITYYDGFIYMHSNGNLLQINASNLSQQIDSENIGDFGYYATPTVFNNSVYVGTGNSNPDIDQFNASNISIVISTFNSPSRIYESTPVLGDFAYGASSGKLYQLNVSDLSQTINSVTCWANSVENTYPANSEFLYKKCTLSNGSSPRLYQFNSSNVSNIIYNFSEASWDYALGNGFIYFASGSIVYQLNATNVSHQISNYTLATTSTDPPVATPQYLFISAGSVMYQLNALDVSQAIGTYTAGGAIDGPPVVAKGFLYFGSDDNNLYQLGTHSPLAAVSIKYPTNGSAHLNVSDLNYTAGGNIADNSCWHSTDGGITNSSTVNPGINFTGLTSSLGQNNWTVYCNDSDSVVFSDTSTFSIDLTSPDINITFPLNTTYNVDVTELNYTYSDLNPDSCWHSTNSGQTNSSVNTAGTNFTGITSTAESNTWTLYCNDSAGNQNTTSVTFTKEIPSIVLTLVSPTGNINATQNLTFDVSVNVSCTNGNCGAINVSLDPAAQPVSCKEILDLGQSTGNGIYTIYPHSNATSYEVYCDMLADEGGWTLVGSVYQNTMDDKAVNYHGNLTTLNPTNSSSTVQGIWDGMRDISNTTYAHGNSTDNVRFSCKQDVSDNYLSVDLVFYQIHWYHEITNSTSDSANCFEEGNGAGDTQPEPARKDLVTNDTLPLDDAWNANGYLEGEDSCGDSSDFTVDFDDRGMDSNQNDGTDWGEDDASKKCGNSTASTGAWFIWFKEGVNYSSEKSGLVSTNETATPFNTNQTNPFNITLNKGESEIITWAVNSTGSLFSNHTFFIYVNKTDDESINNITDKWNVTIVNFTVDYTNPEISITFPSDNSNHTINTIDINYTASDSNLDTCWYSNDTMTFNTTLICGTNITSIIWSEGQHNITIWANDTFTNENSDSVTFSIDTSVESGTGETSEGGSSSGGGGGSLPSSEPDVSKEPECQYDIECKEGYSCYNKECVKLFDIEIKELKPNVKKLSFELQYLVKGMAEIESDVLIKFRIEKEGKVIELGQDTIYLGSFEEKVKTTKLNLPSNIENGAYRLYIEINFENHVTKSFRIINIDLPKSITLDPQLSPETKSNLSNLWWILIILGAMLVFLVNTFRKRLTKDSDIKFIGKYASLSSLKGKAVYSNHGNEIGIIEQPIISKNKIAAWVVIPNKQYKIKNKFLIKNKDVIAIKKIFIVHEHIEKYFERHGIQVGKKHKRKFYYTSKILDKLKEKK